MDHLIHWEVRTPSKLRYSISTVYRPRVWMNHNWILKYKNEVDVAKGSEKHDYRLPIGGVTNHWWYLGLHQTSYPERFPFSSTILVFVTDGWHFFSFLSIRAISGLVGLLMLLKDFTFFGSYTNDWLLTVFVICPTIIGLFFEQFYNFWKSN